MKQPRYLFLFFALSLIAFSFSSCEDPELDGMMDKYCRCISDSRYDEAKRDECFELMEEIKEKYENQPYKMQKVVEKTDNCYN